MISPHFDIKGDHDLQGISLKDAEVFEFDNLERKWACRGTFESIWDELKAARLRIKELEAALQEVEG